ncbi:MAG: phosphate starvation-inducible protein PhoH [Ignavibacteria bacterium GWF2_33_9]|nr:MAG: phosphate starvation-inducible protein PhoH [Ignavibacteria bacterium GWF2_33_9]
MELIERKFVFDDIDFVQFLGLNDQNYNVIESKFKSNFNIRGNSITVTGTNSELTLISKAFDELVYMLKKNGSLSPEDVAQVIGLVMVNTDEDKLFNKNYYSEVVLHAAKEVIKAKTPTQRKYFQKVTENDIVFAIGPAGTGKTFLAVAMAIASLRRNEVSKIVLSRPAVEAGESLGFLPGDLNEKIDPYLKPLTDALQQMLTPEKYKVLLEKGIIEITPLAYMRGRTLNYSFIILDEAQNATITQMKMFLTRLGVHSKAIITGDITQIDLPENKGSGLINAKDILNNIKGIEFIYFTEKDVVRHKLVADIIKAYENAKSNAKSTKDEKHDGYDRANNQISEEA